MDLEKLIEQVAERVISKLTKTNRIVVNKPSTLVKPIITEILDNLVLGSPILLPASKELYSIPAITKHQLTALLACYGYPPIKGATLTAELSRRGIRAFKSELSADTRNRFYIDGRQTQCYAFDKSITTTAELLTAITALKARIPGLSPNFSKF